LDNVIPLFATPIKMYKHDVSSWKEAVIKTEMERMSADNGWLSVNRKILTTDKKFDGLHKIIKESVDDYVYTTCGISKREESEFIIQTSWVVRNDPKDWAHAHHHRNSLFSGCLYFDVPKNSGDFVIHKDPTHMNFMSSTVEFDVDQWNIFNAMRWTFKVEEGLLLMFPSHIRHSVDTNMSNLPRYSLAFNVWYKGKLGDKESELEL
jgi:uncharacterized protein (TIGR02466 family)